jgi:hypothetical protein
MKPPAPRSAFSATWLTVSIVAFFTAFLLV